jgi:putative transcriptional regulator
MVQNLAPGFLIAMPQLGDQNFHRAVVLMVDHSPNGALGLVLNRPANVSLGDLGKGQDLPVADERRHDVVFVGGPVEPQRGFVLHDRDDIEEKHVLAPGLYLSVTLDALKPLLIDPGHRLRFCLGYAGWGAGQIEAEIAQGSWLFSEVSAEGALQVDPTQLWEKTLRDMGVEPAMLQPGRGVH